jgi:hypothetical protein
MLSELQIFPFPPSQQSLNSPLATHQSFPTNIQNVLKNCRDQAFPRSEAWNVSEILFLSFACHVILSWCTLFCVLRWAIQVRCKHLILVRCLQGIRRAIESFSSGIVNCRGRSRDVYFNSTSPAFPYTTVSLSFALTFLTFPHKNADSKTVLVSVRRSRSSNKTTTPSPSSQRSSSPSPKASRAAH